MAGFCLCWLAIPVNTGFLGLLLPFVLVGAISSFWAFALNLYFIGTVSPDDQLGGVMLIFIGTGMIPALATIAINPIVFSLLERIHATSSADLYRRFFLLGLPLCPIMWRIFRRLPRTV